MNASSCDLINMADRLQVLGDAQVISSGGFSSLWPR